MRCIFLLCVITFSFTIKIANAAWHIWRPGEPINVSGSVNLPSGVTQGSFYFTSNLAIGSGVVMAEDCSNNNVQGSKWFYLALPDRVNVGSDGAYLSFKVNGGGFQYYSQNSGWNIYHKWNSYRYISKECFGVGYVHPRVVYNWGSPKVEVTLHDEYKLKPGSYNITNGFRYVFREDRGVSTSAAQNAAIKHLLEGGNIHTFVIKLDYTPKCSINISNISLDFGDFSPEEAEGRVSNSIPFSVTCDKEATVEIGLKGLHPVTGKTENYTDCENNNSCALVFRDGNSYQQRFNNVKSINESVKAIFHPGRTELITSGEFNGNGILIMYFQ
ncbi:hypothetical protein [Escherichia coli]|uniref:hypothetical protein n=1 Tax=Escherichia coli TaxID=562 RepID=UPI001C4029F1|nr:hypothetical protein [Escherichia coli]